MNNIYHLHEKNISQKIIFNSKKNTFFFFFAKTLKKNKISLSYHHHLFINLKKQKQPNKKLYYQKCWEIKIEKKNQNYKK